MIAVRQCGEVALPVPECVSEWRRGKQKLSVKLLLRIASDAVSATGKSRATTRSDLIDGQTVAEKARKLWQDYLRKGCSHEYRNCDNKSGECRNTSWLAEQDFSGCTLAHWQIELSP